jgi:uncharacterized protein (TIGR02722 family)
MKIKHLASVAFTAACVFAAASCASTKPKVERVDAETVIDLDGYWNDNDVTIVCNSLINECVTSKTIAGYKAAHGRAPVAIVGKIRNDSDEHIDTSIVEKKLEYAIINSGAMDFVSDKTERGELREEKLDQADNASPETAKSIGNETGADYMMLGSVKTIVQSADNQEVRRYYVNVEMHDIQTNKIIWMGENSDIKKVVTRPKTKI